MFKQTTHPITYSSTGRSPSSAGRSPSSGRSWPLSCHHLSISMMPYQLMVTTDPPNSEHPVPGAIRAFGTTNAAPAAKQGPTIRSKSGDQVVFALV